MSPASIGLGDAVAFGVVLLCLYLIVLYYSGKTVALQRWVAFLFCMAMIWSLFGVGKRLYIDQVFPPVDAVRHDREARQVAAALRQGSLGSVVGRIAPGNRAYQVGLGIFYALTGASELVAYLVNGGLAFWALVAFLSILARVSGVVRLPFWIVILVAALPSALFWSTTNLKEGCMLWGICMMLEVTPFYQSRALVRELAVSPGRSDRLPLVPFIAGAVVTCSLRPHIAIAWLGGILAGIGIWQRRLKVTIACAAGGLLGMILFANLAPDLTARILTGEAISGLEDFYQRREGLGVSAISFGERGPLPLLSGLPLIFLRPYPFEISNVTGLFAGLEIWTLSLIGLIGWVLTRDRLRALQTPFVITLLVTTLLIALEFSYMYNLGLMVRQRLQILPAVVGLALFPYLIGSSKGPLLIRLQSHRGVGETSDGQDN